MISALINIRDDLGLNVRDEDVLWYRRYTTCSVLDTLKYWRTGEQQAYGNITNNYGYVDYGPMIDPSTGIEFQNYSFSYDIDAIWGDVGYQLS